jgi:catechol 2,3-dioxygenase-like lactoylglutathione lyase family enzyme
MRTELKRLPPHSPDHAEMSARYDHSTQEVDDRARKTGPARTREYPVNDATAAISALPAKAARMLAVEILLADPESLGDDVLESCPGVSLLRMWIEQFTIIVDDYDKAIEFFVGALGFDLVEDSPSLTNDGRPKRWVVVRPPGAQTGILLARADGEHQAAAVGDQMAGRVGFFLRVDDFDAAHNRMTAAGVRFLTQPRTEPYGRVAVFLDIAGNKWDLLGPAS